MKLNVAITLFESYLKRKMAWLTTGVGNQNFDVHTTRHLNICLESVVFTAKQRQSKKDPVLTH